MEEIWISEEHHIGVVENALGIVCCCLRLGILSDFIRLNLLI